MDKRRNPIPLTEQVALRRQAVQDVLSHPQWSLRQSIRHIKHTLRLTTLEMAKLSGIGFRTLQDIEQGRSDGTVQTMNRILGILGMRLGVVMQAAEEDDESSPSP